MIFPNIIGRYGEYRPVFSGQIGFIYNFMGIFEKILDKPGGV